MFNFVGDGLYGPPASGRFMNRPYGLRSGSTAKVLSYIIWQDLLASAPAFARRGR